MSSPAAIATATTPRQIVERVRERVDELTDGLVEQIQAAEHSYAERTLLTSEELRGACRANFDMILGCLASGDAVDPAPAIATGGLKAERGVPLAALLHAYRLAGRQIWGALLAATDEASQAQILPLSAALWRLVDESSDCAVRGYRDMVDHIAQRDVSAREQMVHLLFRQEGASESALHEALRSLKFTVGGPFMVLAHESTQAHDLSACRGVLAACGIVSVWLAEVDGARGLLQLPAASSTHAAESLIDVVDSSIGVSEIFDDFHRVGHASTEARQALRCAPVGSRTVIDAATVPLEMLIVESTPVAAHLARATLGDLVHLPAGERSVLLSTLGAWFDHGGSTASTAQALHYHRNTILNRLKRIEKLTGRDLACPADIAALYVAWSTARLVDLGLDDSHDGSARPAS